MNKENYIAAISKLAQLYGDEGARELMNFIEITLRRIDDEDIDKLSKSAIVEFKITIEHEDGKMLEDYVTLANDGKDLVIIQEILKAEAEAKAKAKVKAKDSIPLQIGIMLDNKGIMTALEAVTDEKQKLCDQEPYSKILDKAMDIEEAEQNSKKKDLSRILNKLFTVSKVPKSLSKEEIKKILNEFNAIAGEKAYHEILRDSIKIKRNMNFNIELTKNNLTEEQKAEEQTVEEQRANITMSKGASNGASSSTNKNPSAMQTDER